MTQADSAIVERTLVGASDERWLLEFLATRDTACPGCGYNLRGLTRPTCPECAQAIRLQVGLVEPRLGMWLAGLVGAAAGLGFNGLLLIYGIGMFIRHGRNGGPPMGVFLGYNSACVLVLTGVVAGWARWRGLFRRMSPAWQWGAVGAQWIVVAADLGGFSALIR